MRRWIVIGIMTFLLGISHTTAPALEPLWVLDIVMNYQDMTIYYAVVDDASQHIDFLSQCPLGWKWKAGEYVQIGDGQYKAKALTEDGFAVTQHGGICVGDPREVILLPDMEGLWI